MYAEWCRDGNTILKLTNPDNTITFSQPDFRSAISTYNHSIQTVAEESERREQRFASGRRHMRGM